MDFNGGLRLSNARTAHLRENGVSIDATVFWS